jgi:hypothetical protein
MHGVASNPYVRAYGLASEAYVCVFAQVANIRQNKKL